MGAPRPEITDLAEVLKLEPISDKLLAIAVTPDSFKAVATRLVCFENCSSELPERARLAVLLMRKEHLPEIVELEETKDGRFVPFSVVNLFIGALGVPPEGWLEPMAWENRALIFTKNIFPILFAADPDKVARKLVGAIGNGSEWPVRCAEECIERVPKSAIYFIGPLITAHKHNTRGERSEMRRLARLAMKRTLQQNPDERILRRLLVDLSEFAGNKNQTQKLALQLTKMLERHLMPYFVREGPHQAKKRVAGPARIHAYC
jgi:hypothetical protein